MNRELSFGQERPCRESPQSGAVSHSQQVFLRELGADLCGLRDPYVDQHHGTPHYPRETST
jgi:hypothetical protein